MIDQVVEELVPVKKSGQQLVVEGLENEDYTLFSDPKMVKNIMLNLLSNAIKYSESGEILCSVKQENGDCIILIKDEGIGIPEEDQKFLFERFFRASNATNSQGTGLGLNIVHQYVHLLDGQIKFESKEGEGTTFRILIPNS